MFRLILRRRFFSSNVQNSIIAAAQQQHAATRSDGTAAAALARALFVDEAVSSPATSNVLTHLYDINESSVVRTAPPAQTTANTTVADLDLFATQPHAIPGALGPHKIVIEDLPKTATEQDIVRAVSHDHDVVEKARLHASRAKKGHHSKSHKASALSGDATASNSLQSSLSSAALAAQSANSTAANDPSSDSSDQSIAAPFAVEIFSDRFRGRLRLNAFVYFVGENDVLGLLARSSKFGVYIRGQRCALYSATSKTCVFIGNIPHSVAEEPQLRDSLTRLGHFPADFSVSLNKGFAFLTFASHDDALRAFGELVSTEALDVWGRDLVVRWGAEMRQERSNVRDLMAQVTRLQAENYRLRLELAELGLKQSNN